MIRFYTFFFSLALLTVGFTLFQDVRAEHKAIQGTDFQSMFEAINRDPWRNYQNLLKLEPSHNQAFRAEYLWFLVRKAQAENLLYFFNDFEKTVNQGMMLVTTSSPAEIASLLNSYSGLIAQRNGRYEESIAFFKRAIVVAKQAGLMSVYIQAKQELAYTRSLTDSYQASLIEIQQAFKQAQTHNDRFSIAMINETYGAIYGYMGEYEQSITFYQKALKLYQELGYRPYEAEAIYGMASTYRYWKKYVLATASFQEYIKKTSYTPNSDVTFFGNYGLGMTLAEKGECAKALVIIKKALSLNGQADYNAELYKREASCYIQLNRLDDAKKSLFKAKTVFTQMEEIEGTRWQIETLKIEAELASASRNYAEAYRLIVEYFEKVNQSRIEKSSKRLANLRTSYEVERRDIKIQLLEQQAEVQKLLAEKQLQQTIFQRYLTIFTGMLGLIILIALIFQRRHTKKIIDISERDSLSGLYNRRYIFQQLKKRLNSQSSEKNNLSIVLLDIDDFKQINDRYGHPFGDHVIRTIAMICQKTLRAEDSMARIGGEEYLCILPRVSNDVCLKIAQRMSQNIASHEFSGPNNVYFSVTVSIGIASSLGVTVNSPNIITTDELFLQADKALYNSKRAGKNRINFF
jgi:diguanylate cyclase (GGDEF)-like protein